MSFVEYYDPDGLFPHVSKQLQGHLPLRNLHWSPSGRPVRSIPALHLDFAPGSRVPKKTQGDAGRRHQLPGLQQTPFLKIFILRCDDKDSYKSQKRDALRSWMSENVQLPPQGKNAAKRENHDAFEWLVLHVVLPNTVAATEPRWTRDSTDLEVPKEKTSTGAKWPGKKPRSILERLRSDFNSSSKSAPDRIAQVRLKKEEIPLDIGPELPPPTASTYLESAKDSEHAWADLTNKLKSLILQSFSLRVAEYEEDIHERDLQRSLPGWNFNTFFILKEGLAKVFESIGLVDEALRGYEELAVGLDSIIDESLSTETSTHSTTFLDYTNEFSSILDAASGKELSATAKQSIASALRTPLDGERKPYREMIVANQISVFDFQCYILARRIFLMIQKAKLSSKIPQRTIANHSNLAVNGEEKSLVNADFEDVNLLADICQLGTDSVPQLSRLLRRDLSEGQSLRGEAHNLSAIDVVVTAWTFAAAAQVYSHTGSKHFAEAQAPELPPKPTKSGDSKRSNRRSMMNALQQAGPGNSLLQVDNATATKFRGSPGLVKAAAQRAELCSMQRRILQRVMMWKHWEFGKPVSDEEITEEDDSRESSPPPIQDSHETNGMGDANSSLDHLGSSLLAEASATIIRIKEEYEYLSDSAAWLFSLAGRKRSSEQLLVDLAKLKFNENDYLAAVAYLGPLVASFGQRRWTSVETALQQMHAYCLKMLNRKDDHVRTVMSLLAKCAEYSQRSLASGGATQNKITKSKMYGMRDVPESTDEVFQEVIEYSNQLPYDIQFPFTDYFDLDRIDRFIKPFEDRDGFGLGFRVRSLVCDKIHGAQSTAELHGEGESEGLEVFLCSEEQSDINATWTRVQLTCNTSTFGYFFLAKLSIRVGKIVFVQDMIQRPRDPSPFAVLTGDSPQSEEPANRQSILCYSHARALSAHIRSASVVSLGKSRDLELHIDPGENDVETAQVSIKSLTAGLRLHTARARSKESVEVSTTDTPSVLKVSRMTAHCEAVIAVPYSIDHNFPVLKIRLEINYVKEGSTFQFLRNAQVRVKLGLDVNVEDVFRSDSIFSKFYLAPTTTSPIVVNSVNLQGTKYFDVEKTTDELSGLTIFSNDSPCVTFRVTPQTSLKGDEESNLRTLNLNIRYVPLLDLITEQMIANLKNVISKSPYQQYCPILVANIEDGLREYLDERLLEMSALLGSFKVPPFEKLGWTDILQAISEDEKPGLKDWIRGWHETVSPVRLDRSDTTMSTQELLIDVEVPSLDFLHSASFQILDQQSYPKLQSQGILTKIGVLLSCQLTLAYTTRWAFASDLSEGEHHRFECSLQADSSQWLICGPTQFTYTSAPNRDNVFNLTIIPLKPGTSTLPTLEIRPLNLQSTRNVASASPAGAVPPSTAAIFSPTSLPIGGKPSWRSPSVSPSSQPQRRMSPLTSETYCSTAGWTITIVEGLENTAIGVGDEQESTGSEAPSTQLTVLETSTWSGHDFRRG